MVRNSSTVKGFDIFEFESFLICPTDLASKKSMIEIEIFIRDLEMTDDKHSYPRLREASLYAILNIHKV